MTYKKVFGRSQTNNVLCVHISVKKGHHEGKDRGSMVLGRFGSTEAGKCANTVPWYVAMEEDVRTKLAGLFIEGSRWKKKRPETNVSPETDKNQPL